jgi:hypothetical protein
MKKEAASPLMDVSDQMARERSNDLFRGWIENAKKSTKIERNPTVLSQMR